MIHYSASISHLIWWDRSCFILLYCSIPTQLGSTLAWKVIVFHLPKPLAIIETNFFPCSNITPSKERQLRKAKVLMMSKHSNGDHIWLANMVEESCKVSNAISIHTKRILSASQYRQVKQVWKQDQFWWSNDPNWPSKLTPDHLSNILTCILSLIRFRIANNFATVLGNKTSLWYRFTCPNTPSHSLCPKHFHQKLYSFSRHSIFTIFGVTWTQVRALIDHRNSCGFLIRQVNATTETSIAAIPSIFRHLIAQTALFTGTAISTRTRLHTLDWGV